MTEKAVWEGGLTGVAGAVDIAGRLIVLLLLTPILAPTVALYVLVRQVASRPPVVPDLTDIARVVRRCVTASEVPKRVRIRVALAAARRTLTAPLAGLAWLFDEWLYGPALRAATLVSPVIEISAARSGSTQLAHYLEDLPSLVAPTLGQTLYPYRWLWRLLRRLPNPLSAERVQAILEAQVPPGFLERHEFDLNRATTFEVAFMHSRLGDLTWLLGEDVYEAEHGPARRTPTNNAYWDDFLRFFDGVARRVAVENPGKRVMIKGHFLAVADDLARIYPDARFVTVVRRPLARLRSVINHHRHQPGEAGLPPAPWAWIVSRALRVEADYCDEEMAFYQRSDVKACVVAFDDYVADLPGTLRRVCRLCLDQDPPADLPTTHAARERQRYTVDRSLEELGVDVAATEARFAAFTAWCTAASQGDRTAA